MPRSSHNSPSHASAPLPQDEHGQTWVHRAPALKDGTKPFAQLKDFNNQELARELGTRDIDGDNPAHMVVRNRNDAALNDLMALLRERVFLFKEGELPPGHEFLLQTNNAGLTPMHMAFQNGFGRQIVAGVDPQYQNRSKEMWFFGPLCRAKDGNGRVLAHIAVLQKDPELFRWAMAQALHKYPGADLTDNQGVTPLQLAVQTGFLDALPSRQLYAGLKQGEQPIWKQLTEPERNAVRAAVPSYKKFMVQAPAKVQKAVHTVKNALSRSPSH